MVNVYPGVNRVRRRLTDGSVTYHYYWRATGAKLEGEPGTMAFQRSYDKAKLGEQNAKGSKINDLINLYEKSPNFRVLAKNTRTLYTSALTEIAFRFGKMPIAAMGNKGFKGDALEFRDEIALKTPMMAERTFVVLKILSRFADDRGLIEFNHLRGASSLRSPSRAENIWDKSKINKLLSVASEPLKWAILLALLTGQRAGDLIRMKWIDIQNDMICIKQQKTLAKVQIPVGSAIHHLITHIVPRKADTILTNEYGRAWSLNGSGLRSAWQKAMSEAGLENANLHFHDLRGTAVTVLADMGCTNAQIAAITGHSLESVAKILKAYLAPSALQARAAMTALENSWIGQIAGNVQTKLQTVELSA